MSVAHCRQQSDLLSIRAQPVAAYCCRTMIRGSALSGTRRHCALSVSLEAQISPRPDIGILIWPCSRPPLRRRKSFDGGIAFRLEEHLEIEQYAALFVVAASYFVSRIACRFDLRVRLPETLAHLVRGHRRDQTSRIDDVRSRPRMHHRRRGPAGENAMRPVINATAISNPRAKPNPAPSSDRRSKVP